MIDSDLKLAIDEVKEAKISSILQKAEEKLTLLLRNYWKQKKNLIN